jgi:hypothetical protein
MAPFEALYGKKCRTPLLWDGVGECSLFGPDLIKEAEEKVRLIRDRLKVAQSRQKSYADSKRREVTYEIGYRAYLRVSPLRGVKRFGIKGKLAPRFIGPYKILARKGEVAYELELPEALAAVHNVFHVSQLKKCHPEMADTPLRDTVPDAGWPSVTSTPRPTSPPSGPMTRARVKALHDEVNSLLTTLDLGTPLDGLLPHADVLCVIRYKARQDHGEEETPRSREGEKQLDMEMIMKPKPTSHEALQGRDGRWPVQDPVRPDLQPDAPVIGPVDRAQTGPAPSYRTTTGNFAVSRFAPGRPDP